MSDRAYRECFFLLIGVSIGIALGSLVSAHYGVIAFSVAESRVETLGLLWFSLGIALALRRVLIWVRS